VQKLAFAIFQNLTFHEKPYQQAGALQLKFFNSPLRLILIFAEKESGEDDDDGSEKHSDSDSCWDRGCTPCWCSSPTG
jgi:hypothetical protein